MTLKEDITVCLKNIFLLKAQRKGNLLPIYRLILSFAWSWDLIVHLVISHPQDVPVRPQEQVVIPESQLQPLSWYQFVDGDGISCNSVPSTSYSHLITFAGCGRGPATSCRHSWALSFHHGTWDHCTWSGQLQTEDRRNIHSFPSSVTNEARSDVYYATPGFDFSCSGLYWFD